MSIIEISSNPLTRNRTHSISSCETSIHEADNTIDNSLKPINQNPKKRSRVCLLLSKLEDSIEKEDMDVYSDHYDSFNEGRFGERISIDLSPKDFTIKVNYDITIGQSNCLFTHKLTLANDAYFSEVIYKAIEAFNDSYHQIKDSDGSIYNVYYLTSDYSKYECKPSKKNGKPKEDMPSFSKDTTLNKIMASSMSLVFLEDSLIKIKV